jgi:hypothetical protein
LTTTREEEKMDVWDRELTKEEKRQFDRGFVILPHDHDIDVWGACTLDGCEFGSEDAAENYREYEEGARAGLV